MDTSEFIIVQPWKGLVISILYRRKLIGNDETFRDENRTIPIFMYYSQFFVCSQGRGRKRKKCIVDAEYPRRAVQML